jgi:hypothetical protein
MWHALASVSSAHDPILYEGQSKAHVLVLNVGPGRVLAKAWSDPNNFNQPASINMQLRAGDQRILCGCLVRVVLIDDRQVGKQFAAVGWRIVSTDQSSLLS